jgi:hypothetical protein
VNSRAQPVAVKRLSAFSPRRGRANGTPFATPEWRAPTHSIARNRREGRPRRAHARNLAPRRHKGRSLAPQTTGWTNVLSGRREPIFIVISARKAWSNEGLADGVARRVENGVPTRDGCLESPRIAVGAS